MLIKFPVYNKEKDSIEYFEDNFEWKELKDSTNQATILQVNRYLYNKQAKQFYRKNNIQYKAYLYDAYLDEQFNNLIP